MRWGADGWWPGALASASPNADERPAGAAVELLVIHYISLPPGRFSGDAVQDLFLNRLDTAAHPALADLAGLRVSSHFFIRRDGRLLQFVDGDRRAWHAGASQFEGRERCNDFSLGIELEGDGEHAFTQRQYRRLVQLVGALCERYPLRAVQGHSDIAPGRKQDPGPHFDWALLADSLERLSSRAAAKKIRGSRLKLLADSARRRPSTAPG